MSKFLIAIAAAATTVSIAAADVCTTPEAPEFTTDRSDVSRNEMLEMFRAVKSFQVGMSNYRECLVGEEDSLGNTSVAKLHNASIDTEKAVAVQFNRVFEAFKAKSRTAGKA